MELLETEVLLIGCGIAGSTAALGLAKQGIKTTVITRAQKPEDCNSYWAQGGIIYQGQEDSTDLLAKDILAAGAGLCNPEAVKLLAEKGPELVETLLLSNATVKFDRDANNALDLVKEAAHSKKRILHVADETGKAIELALLNKLHAHPNIQLLTEHTAIDLLTPDHHSSNLLDVYGPKRCVGAYVLDSKTGIVKRMLAKKTVLASGGVGQVYRYSTNAKGARGDGLAMAYRAGARVINNEYVQFHPTMFFKPGAANFLISEAVRGTGARLVHADGQPFMQTYDAKWKDLAPRDVVARSIHQEMVSKDLPNVYLDLKSYIAADVIQSHFPNLYKQCLEQGIDMSKDLVPVIPGAHYFCGGVWTDVWGQTSIEHLYAVGEVSCTGLHGANRLASTSLLEGLVWGHQAAKDVARKLSQTKLAPSDTLPPWQYTAQEDPDPVLIARDMQTIRHIMWLYVGLERNASRLARALRELRHLETEIEEFYRSSKLTDAMIGLRNAVRAAAIIASAAWANKNSIGCHYRSDASGLGTTPMLEKYV